MCDSKELPSFLRDPAYVRFDASESDRVNNKVAAHCVIFARTKDIEPFHKCPERAYVMLGLRLDGSFGFFGGFVDEGESILDGLNREIMEEINVGKDMMIVTQDDFIACTRTVEKTYGNLENHLYAKEVSEEVFKKIERMAPDAEHFGTEIRGLVRAPLYTYGHRQKGLPWFLMNNFAGGAKLQLLHFLFHSKLLTEEEISEALKPPNK